MSVIDMSAIRSRVRLLRRMAGAEEGSVVTEFALILPVLLMLSFGIIDFTLAIFDYHRAGEAVRRGTRVATIEAPVADLSTLTQGTSYVCTSGGGVACTGAAVNDAVAFTTIVTAMQAVLPAITAANVQIVYDFSGVGDNARPGGVLPFVTVSLVNYTHNFTLLNAIPGMPPSFVFPSFAVTQLAGGSNPPGN